MLLYYHINLILSMSFVDLRCFFRSASKMLKFRIVKLHFDFKMNIFNKIMNKYSKTSVKKH